MNEFLSKIKQELLNLNCTEEEAIEILSAIDESMINAAIKNEVRPEDYAWAIIQ